MILIRFIRRLFSADVMALLLVVFALQAFTYGIASSLRNTDTRYFFWVCFLAALLALGLNKLMSNGIQASVVMILIGVMGIWLIAARLIIPLLDLGNALLGLTPQIIPALRSHIPVDTSALAEPWRIVTDASLSLNLRLQGWLISLGKGETLDDSLIRSMIWTLIVWLIASWLGWFTGKRNAIVALLPSILLLAAVTSYSEQRVYTLWVVVFVLLLLMGIWNYKNHTTQWEKKKVDYSDSIRYDVSQSVIFLALLIGSVAFFTPSVSWRQIRDFLHEWHQPAHNETADILGVQQAPVASKKVPVAKPSLPRDHLLTEGYAQSQQIVMTIRTGELPPIANSTITANPPRYYWRSVTYDTYVGAGWVSSPAPAQKFQANTPLIPGLLKGYKTLHLDVKLYEPEGKLFWSGILFSADVPFTASWRIRPQSDLFVDQSKLLQADMFAALSNSTAYKAESYVPLVTIMKLREAFSKYPEDIKERYLQLPDSLPPRVRQLSKQLTAGETNAYDRAKAIEAYLRTYPYDLNIPAPPTDRDVTDYFLFDLKKGYCDYYATAMVVLARASGIPARFVSGYSSGDYAAADAQYVIREINAHSWAEIYFPEIGWIEFEPTASQPEIDRSSIREDQAAAAQNPDPAVKRILDRFRLIKAIYWFAPIVIVLLFLILYYMVIERWRYLRLAPNFAIEKIYRKLYQQGRFLAGERTKAETAYEFKQKLINRIDVTGKGYVFKRILFSAPQDVELLTQLYEATLFRQNTAQKSDTKKALKIWKHLRPRLWLARLDVLVVTKVKAISQFFNGLLTRGIQRDPRKMVS